jgi:hypothetical protein
MTGNSSVAEPSEAFNASLLQCVEDINKLLPGLARRYDMTVIMSALAEHVGSALKALLHKKVCDIRQVHQVIENIQAAAFLKKSAQPKPESATEESAPDAVADGAKPEDSDT